MLGVFRLSCYLEDICPHHCPQTPLKQENMPLMLTEIFIVATLACLSFFTHHGAIKGADHPGGDNCSPQIHASHCRQKVRGSDGSSTALECIFSQPQSDNIPWFKAKAGA